MTGSERYVTSLIQDPWSGILYYGERTTSNKAAGKVGLIDPGTGLSRSLVHTSGNVECVAIHPKLGYASL